MALAGGISSSDSSSDSSVRCSNHVCCLHNVKGFEKGIGIFIIFNTGKVSLSQFLLVPPLC